MIPMLLNKYCSITINRKARKEYDLTDSVRYKYTYLLSWRAWTMEMRCQYRFGNFGDAISSRLASCHDRSESFRKAARSSLRMLSDTFTQHVDERSWFYGIGRSEE